MNINFNPSAIPKTEPTQPPARSDAAAATDGTAFEATSALTNKLSSLPAVRSEKVAQAKALVSHQQYPPNDVMDRIAVLLATNINQ
jgi:hypothetical protein